MDRSIGRKIGCLLIISGFLFLAASLSHAEEKKDMGGWEIGSPYNQNYDAFEMDSFKGRVEKIEEITPMPGMSPGVVLHVREKGADITIVHVCPTWYMGKNDIGIKRGDRVKVRGVWAEIDGKDVVMASKIKRGDFFSLKVRLTKDGTPFWTMDPEQLAKEKEAVGSR